MDELLHDDDLLIRYLDSELSVEEKKSLENRLQNDPALREKLVHLQVAVQAVKQLGTTLEVASVHQEMMQHLKPRKTKLLFISKTVRYAMAVAAGIFVLFIGVRLYLAAQVSPEELYEEAFVDFNVSGTRSNDTITAIESRYQQKDYAAVIRTPRSLALHAKDSLLIGLSYLNTKNTIHAIGFFERISLYDNEYRQDGEFYLSLSYLKSKNYAKALPLMQKIAADSSHLYHGQFSEEFVEKVKALAK